MSLLNKRGMTLAVAVMVILFVSVAVSGVTVFIVQRLSQGETQSYLIRSVYLAQAGLHLALYDFRVRDGVGNGYVTLGQVNLDADNYSILGGEDAGFVLVDPSAVVTGGRGNRTLRNFTLQNANNSRSVTIDRMIVRWDDPGNRLERITLNGRRSWRGRRRSPVDVNIRNRRLNTVPTTYGSNSLRFRENLSSVSYIDVEFIMTDGSSKAMRLYPASNDRTFMVSATGKATGSNIYRTVKAEYNVATSTVIDYIEVSDEIAP